MVECSPLTTNGGGSSVYFVVSFDYLCSAEDEPVKIVADLGVGTAIWSHPTFASDCIHCHFGLDSAADQFFACRLELRRRSRERTGRSRCITMRSGVESSQLVAAHCGLRRAQSLLRCRVMMGGYGAGMGGGWGLGMGFGWIIPIVVIGLIVWAIVAFARSRTGDTGTEGATADRSLAILKERYAKGELDSEAYQRMRKELEH
jgi:putative membrane protein